MVLGLTACPKLRTCVLSALCFECVLTQYGHVLQSAKHPKYGLQQSFHIRTQMLTVWGFLFDEKWWTEDRVGPIFRSCHQQTYTRIQYNTSRVLNSKLRSCRKYRRTPAFFQLII